MKYLHRTTDLCSSHFRRWQRKIGKSRRKINIERTKPTATNSNQHVKNTQQKQASQDTIQQPFASFLPQSTRTLDPCLVCLLPATQSLFPSNERKNERPSDQRLSFLLPSSCPVFTFPTDSRIMSTTPPSPSSSSLSSSSSGKHSSSKKALVDLESTESTFLIDSDSESDPSLDGKKKRKCVTSNKHAERWKTAAVLVTGILCHCRHGWL